MVVAARERSHDRLAGPAWDLEVNNGHRCAKPCATVKAGKTTRPV